MGKLEALTPEEKELRLFLISEVGEEKARKIFNYVAVLMARMRINLRKETSESKSKKS